MCRVDTFQCAAETAALFDMTRAFASSTINPNQQPKPQPPRLNAIAAVPAPAPAPPGYPPRQKLTPDLMKELAARNACFYCREVGHSIRECPTRPPMRNALGNGLPQ